MWLSNSSTSCISRPSQQLQRRLLRFSVWNKEELERKSVNTLFKNQGIYNGLISVLILLAVFAFGNITALMILMAYIILVAIYGGITSNPKIILMQGGLAIITLVLCILL